MHIAICHLFFSCVLPFHIIESPYVANMIEVAKEFDV